MITDVQTTPRYEIFTWDVETQRWTPQVGLPEGPFTMFGLRVPLRLLRQMGYVARGGDPFVLVQEV